MYLLSVSFDSRFVIATWKLAFGSLFGLCANHIIPAASLLLDKIFEVVFGYFDFGELNHGP